GKRLAPSTVARLLDDYYRLRGWDEHGIPTPAKLKELGLDYTLPL
ncbi:MAG TPA: hypothetical protein DEQ28_05860, partial [Clostridiales bacterium]|nr:hypothetical protein [Clostridiales bacterium]